MGMTGTIYKLLKERGQEHKRIQKAAGKQSLWSKIGRGLGGLLAIGLTGGAAAPWVAGLMAGAGTLAGGLIGRKAARENWFNTKGGKIKAGRVLKDEAASLKKMIGEDIWAGAGKAALTAFGGGLAGKGLSALKGAGTAAETAKTAHQYSDTLFGKLGKAIDIKGSAIGKGVSAVGKIPDKIQSFKTGRELQSMGESAVGTTDAIVGGTGSTIQGPPVAGARIRTPIAAENIAARVEAGEAAAIRSQYGDIAGIGEGVYAELPQTADMHLPVSEVGGGDVTSFMIEPTAYSPDTVVPFDRSDILTRQSAARYRAALPDTSIPTSYGGGADFTTTSAWEGVGESFPVTSPGLPAQTTGTFGLPRGYDYQSVAGKRHRDILDTIRWQDRLFGE